MNGFDILAPVYDKLAGFFFGSAIRQAQFHYIGHIQPGWQILMIGGGTGDLAKGMLDRFQGIHITYVETSAKMVALAAEKCVAYGDRIDFVQDTVDTIPLSFHFDAVITPFFLDMFSDNKVGKLVEDLTRRLKPGGKWIATDFKNSPKPLHKLMLWIMYRFFGLVCNIQARSLPSWEKSLGKHLCATECKDFYGGFIRSCVYTIAR